MRYLFTLLLISGVLMTSSHADELDSISDPGLKNCISNYRYGYYSRAVECINAIMQDLTTFRDSLEAYKMLALSYGMVNQIDKAKENFNLALDKNPAMEIDTLAFPPNIAIIYNQVKLEKKAVKSDSVPNSQVVSKKRNIALPVILLSSVILSTGGAVYLCYNGYLAHEDYSKERYNQKRMDKKWDEFTYSAAGGVGCAVISGVATWLFFRVIKHNDAVSISGSNNRVALVYNF
jgi:tetratricopeptide (TPR) repeat protein